MLNQRSCINLDIKNLLSSTDLATASITTSEISTDRFTNLAITVTITGLPVGVFQLQASTSNLPTGSIPTSSFDDIPGASLSVSGATQWTWNVSGISASHIRLVYTKTSGTGTITVLTYIAKD